MKSFQHYIQAVLCLLYVPVQGFGREKRGINCGSANPSREETLQAEYRIQQYKNSLGPDFLAKKVDRSRGSIEIEVFWYIFMLADGTGAVTDETIERQMAVLNEAFAGIVEGTENSFPPCSEDADYDVFSFEYGETNPTPFTFTLNNITRVEVTEDEFNQDTDAGQAKMGEIRANSGEDCSKAFIFTGDSDTRDGSSNFPWYCQDYIDEDHTFIKYTKLTGIIDDYEYEYQGDVTVHEMGHWLGLLHTFSDAEAGCPSEDADDICRHGDMVLDTPPMNDQSDGCSIGRDSCPNSPGEDAIHNYMDYSWACCVYLFSLNQVERMTLFTEYYRFGIGDALPVDDGDTFDDEIETINLCDVWTPAPSPSPDSNSTSPSPTSCCDDNTKALNLFDLLGMVKKGVIGSSH